MPARVNEQFLPPLRFGEGVRGRGYGGHEAKTPAPSPKRGGGERIVELQTSIWYEIMMNRIANHLRVPLAVGLFVCLPMPVRAIDDLIDSPMYRDPDLPVPRVEFVLPDGAVALWVKALAQPEAELKCQTSDAIALARGRGLKGLETTVAPLRAAFDSVGQHPSVRLATARALVALDAKDAAAILLEHSQTGGGDLRAVVEPALARWDHRPARALWLGRLNDPATPPRDLILALQGLAAVAAPAAADRARALAIDDRTPGPIRLEAARAASRLFATGLEPDAERLSADPSPRAVGRRLAGAMLLRGHQGDTAIRLLQKMAADTEPAVAAIAVARLIEIDPAVAVPILVGLIASPDANLRGLAVETLLKTPTVPHVKLLADRLIDADPSVRVNARKAMKTLAATKDLNAAVIAESMRILSGRDWRGQEQSALLLAQLDHKPAAGRFVELLRAERPEVFVSAAWGLRALAVPATLPAVAKHVDAERGRFRGEKILDYWKGVSLESVDLQMTQLNQLLGILKYAPAESMLRKFIPRPEQSHMWLGIESRAAAVWALGKIHEGQPKAELTAALIARVTDTASTPPENAQVIFTSTISLGRMKAADALPTLRINCPNNEPATDIGKLASGWAIERITGEPMPTAKTTIRPQREWFLLPSD